MGQLACPVAPFHKPRPETLAQLMSIALISPEYLACRNLDASGTGARLSGLERMVLAVGIWEIPLQLDKYFFFRVDDSELGAVAGLNVSLTTVALIVLYVLWWLDSLVRRPVARASIIWGWPMLAYVAFVTLSLLSAEVISLAFFDLMIVVQAYVLFFYLANRLRQRSDILFCAGVLVAMLLTQCGIVFGLASLGQSGHGQRYEYGPLAMVVWEDGRVAGTLISAVVCGAVLAFWWLPTVALTLTVRSPGFWWCVAIATLAGVLAVLLTQTRGAIVSMLVGGAILGGAMYVRGWLPKWTLAAVLAAGLLGAYPFISVVRDRVLGDDNGSAESRKHLSLIALQMIEDRPLFGFGAGNCHLAALPYANQGAFRAEWYYTIHCKYLLAWVETGLGGLLTFLMVLAAAFYYSLKAWQSEDRVLAALGLSIAASLVGSMLHMVVDLFNSRAQVQLLWAYIGFAAALYRITSLQSAALADFDDCPVP